MFTPVHNKAVSCSYSLDWTTMFDDDNSIKIIPKELRLQPYTSPITYFALQRFSVAEPPEVPRIQPQQKIQPRRSSRLLATRSAASPSTDPEVRKLSSKPRKSTRTAVIVTTKGSSMKKRGNVFLPYYFSIYCFS
jgi:hypothetical protein